MSCLRVGAVTTKVRRVEGPCSAAGGRREQPQQHVIAMHRTPQKLTPRHFAVPATASGELPHITLNDPLYIENTAMHHRARHVRIEDQYGDKYITTPKKEKNTINPLITTPKCEGYERRSKTITERRRRRRRDTNEGRDTNALGDYCKQKERCNTMHHRH